MIPQRLSQKESLLTPNSKYRSQSEALCSPAIDRGDAGYEFGRADRSPNVARAPGAASQG
jgi:hypothetical protein